MGEPQKTLTPFLERQGFLMLDGGLATELEVRGHDLSDALWSARLLLDAPEAIVQLHQDYLEAGADCIISASYQASVAGLVGRGLSRSEAEEQLVHAVRLAHRARDAFWREPANRAGRLYPLVAASVGPYGAYLADGSEYTGEYGLDEEALIAFHRSRWEILAGSGPDLMACETIPSAVEVRALARIMAEQSPKEHREIPAWVTVSCRDHMRLSDGTLLQTAMAPLLDLPQVVALGINCTAPRYVPALLAELRGMTAKPLVVYPNSGETYDAEQGCWLGLSEPVEFGDAAVLWRRAGARLIGGCCRTGPAHIRRMRAALWADA